MSGFISYPFLKGAVGVATPAELAFIKWQEPQQHLRLDLRSSISLRSMLPYALPVPVTAVGGGALVTGETDALGIDFTYFTDRSKQMAVITSSVEVDSDPYATLTYTSPAIKLCRQSDGVWRYGSHNLYLNSASPANQSITVVSSGTYAIVITGSVSITLSGATTGTVTAGTTNFTAATTTLTCGSTSGTGTVAVYRTPSVGTYLATTGSAVYDLPYEWNVAAVSQGILIEEARANLLQQSQVLGTTWTADNVSISSNAVVAPDATTTADTLVENSSSSNHREYQQITLSAAATFTASAFVKAGSGTRYPVIIVVDSANPHSFWAAANLSNGTVLQSGATNGGVLTSSSIVDAGNGWYRLTVTGTVPNANPFVALANWNTTTPASSVGGDGQLVYTGDGSSSLTYWGIQAEPGAFATSPIHTIGASVTRVVDTLSLATSGFPVNATKGTLYAKFNPINVGAIRYALAQDDDTANEHLSIGSSAAAAGQFNVVDGGAQQTAPLTNGTVTAGSANKVAASWQANDFAVSTNGAAVSTDVSGTLPTVTKLKLGVGNVSTNVLNGYLQHVVSLPRDMTDGELQTRST